jgi:competence ComEA-like helix-hairpin-helix protein
MRPSSLMDDVVRPPDGPTARADGRSDINLADATLCYAKALPSTGPAIAQRITQYRELNGPFDVVEESQRARGIGQMTFGRIE